MSTMNPKSSNGKQSATGSSLCTPSGTPVNSIATNTGNSVAQNSPPPCANAPKYGTLVPNRIFVGGIAANTTEAELLTLFTQYGTVKAAKIIQDRAGVSKGYGFVTFENEQDAHLAMRDADNILLRERKLNIAPAIKKQPFSRVFGESTSPSLPTGNPSYYMTPGTIPYYQGGVTYFSQAQPQTPGESATPQATMYQPAPQVFPTQTGPPQQPAFQSVMFPAQPMYMPQFMPLYDYNYYATGSGSMAPPGGQYMVGGGSGGAGGQGAPPLQPPPTSASPPRPPPACYGAGQQLGTYGAPPPHDSMYYAMPAMYGPPMDAASAAAGPGAIYATECIELPNGGYGEETPYASLVHMDIHNQHHPHNHNHPSENGLDSAIAVLPSVSLAQHSDSTLSLERQSNTPVVSLLNIDHHQEKDYTSMQSGRRRKSTSSSSVVTPSVSPYLNGYTNNNNNSPRAINNNDPTNSYGGGCYQNIYNTTAYPPCTMYNYNGSASPIQLAPPSVPVSAAGYLPDPSQYRFRGPPMNGGFMFAPHKKRRFVNHNNNNNNNNDRRPPTDQSRRSSVRTNSNSSTSVGEELRDERGFAGGSGCMFAQSSNHSYGNYSGYGGYNGRANNNGSKNGSRNYNYNGTRVVYGSNNNYVDRKTGAGGSGRSSAAKSVASVVVESGKVGSSNSEKPSGIGPSTSTVTAATETGTATGISTTSTVTKDKSVERDDKGVEGKVVNGPLAQVHPSGGNPSFLPPRRSRRTVRRSGTAAGSSLSEIGAGDAPLPQDLTDACSKKMEGLKL